MLTEHNPIALQGDNLPPTVPIPKAGKDVCGLKRPTIYKLLNEHKISAIKSGRRTLLVTSSIVAYLNTLPPAEFGKKKKPTSEK